jgi:hypothetical protein
MRQRRRWRDGGGGGGGRRGDGGREGGGLEDWMAMDHSAATASHPINLA